MPVAHSTINRPLSATSLRRPAEFSVPRRRPRFSVEVLAAAAAVVDFCLVAAATIGGLLYFQLRNDPSAGAPRYGLVWIFAATLFVIAFDRLGGYRFKRLRQLRWQLLHVSMVWAACIAVLLLVAFVGKMSDIYSRGWALAWVGTALSLLLIERGILYVLVTGWIRAGYLARNIIILGAGNEGERLLAKLQHSPDPAVTICGLFDDRKSRLPSVLGLNVLGDTDDLINFVRRNPVDEVIVALPLNAQRQLTEIFSKLRGLPIDLRLSIEPVAYKYDIRGVSYVSGVPVFEIADRPLKNWHALAKWMEDKILSVLLLLWLGPLMVFIAMLIKIDSPGPVFFIQERFGFNNNVIRVLKFRTMHVHCCDASGGQRTVRNDPRVSRVGHVLRRLSLDELPQLLNVLRGDMSLVGPRPHAVAMQADGRLYGDAVDEYFHRHRVKPGITGWAQVNGFRGEVDTLEKARARVDHDLYYIDHWTLWFDLKILLMTVGILVAPDNAY
jgi:Undecaprenyl-phosphate glucose phosphotransferase